MPVYEVIGIFCLSALWVTALLVASQVCSRAKYRRLAVSFAAAELVMCAACTRLATLPPLFNGWSTLGGVLCLAFFLGVTPVGVWVGDRAARKA